MEISNFIKWVWVNNRLMIDVYGNGERKLIPIDHSPYFYVESPNLGLDVDYTPTSMVAYDTGCKLWKVEVDRPSRLKDIRDKFYRTYEGDVMYHRRLAIDDVLRYNIKRITYYDIEVSSTGTLLAVTIGTSVRNNKHTPLSSPDFTSSLSSDTSVSKDNSVVKSVEDEVVCLSLEKDNDSYVLDDNRDVLNDNRDINTDVNRDISDNTSIYVIRRTGVPTTSVVIETISGDEQEIIFQMCNHIRRMKTDVMVGWNNLGYDREKLIGMMNRLNMKKELYLFEGIPQIDLMWEYKKKRRPARMSLDYAAIREGFGGKDVIQNKAFMERVPIDELRAYNRHDVELLVNINEKYGLVELVCELAELTGVGVEEQSAMRMVDAMILRKAHETGRAVQTAKPSLGADDVEGATVFDAPQEMLENVAVFDFESLYPSIILREGIGASVLRETLADGLECRRAWATEYIYTRDATAKLRSDAYKVINNATYGVMGNKYFRLYSVKDQAQVTESGRGLLKAMGEEISRMKFKVIYGDTDSVFVQCSLDEAKQLWSVLVEKLSPYSLKLEKFYRRLMFPGGAKKRYAGHLVWDRGKTVDDIDITGLEAVRMDWCELAKEIQTEIITSILRDGRDRTYVTQRMEDVRKRLFNHEYDDKLIITKRIEVGKEYTTNLPHVRAYALLRSYNRHIEGDRIEYVYVRKSMSGCDVFPVIEDWKSKIDYNWYWEHQIKSVVGRIMEVAFPVRMSLGDFTC